MYKRQEYHAFGDAVSLTLKSAIDDLGFVKFVLQEQENRQHIFSLAELMILRYLTDNRRIRLADAQGLTQMPIENVRNSCAGLVKDGLIEVVGKESVSYTHLDMYKRQLFVWCETLLHKRSVREVQT